jgi:hypothetical protein
MASETEVQRVKAQHELALLDLPGVQGVGIGDSGSDVVIKVYVDEATPAVTERIPREIEGVPVVVEQTGEFHAL